MQDIWILRSADSRNLSLIPRELDYFQTHFVGKAMRDDWRPPPVKVYGKSLRLRDFVSWMVQSPVVSEKAKNTLDPVIGDLVEFLPLVELKRQHYFAMNVIKLVDCLDRNESKIVFSPNRTNEILSIKTYHFVPSRVEDCAVFKLPDAPSVVFVRQSFVNVVIRSRLTGAKFADPAENPWRGVMRGESCNVIPGVLD